MTRESHPTGGHQLKRWFLIIGAVSISAWIVFLVLSAYSLNQARQARFNIEVLSRYLKAYRLTEGILIQSLTALPDFEIISAADSLSFRSADLKKSPIIDGYVYDMQFLPPARYVITASPIGWLAPRIKFGVTERGEIKRSEGAVDTRVDNYEDVEGWAVDTGVERIRTKKLPEYLRD